MPVTIASLRGCRRGSHRSTSHPNPNEGGTHQTCGVCCRARKNSFWFWVQGATLSLILSIPVLLCLVDTGHSGHTSNFFLQIWTASFCILQNRDSILDLVGSLTFLVLWWHSLTYQKLESCCCRFLHWTGRFFFQGEKLSVQLLHSVPMGLWFSYMLACQAWRHLCYAISHTHQTGNLHLPLVSGSIHREVVVVILLLACPTIVVCCFPLLIPWFWISGVLVPGCWPVLVSKKSLFGLGIILPTLFYWSYAPQSLVGCRSLPSSAYTSSPVFLFILILVWVPLLLLSYAHC